MRSALSGSYGETASDGDTLTMALCADPQKVGCIRAVLSDGMWCLYCQRRQQQMDEIERKLTKQIQSSPMIGQAQSREEMAKAVLDEVERITGQRPVRVEWEGDAAVVIWE